MKHQTKLIYLFLVIFFLGHNCAPNSERLQAKQEKKAQKTAKTEHKKEAKQNKKEARNSKKNNQTKPTQHKAKNTNKNYSSNQIEENYQALIEANIEAIAELEAQVNYLQETLAFYQAGSSAETSLNTAVFNKKIILNNGSSIFGKIIYQDDYIIQVETVIGTLTIDKNSVIRVVDFQMSQLNPNQDMINLNVVQKTTNNDDNQFVNSAKVILLGEFLEAKDSNNNTLLSGEVKNIGVKRADFVKITFTIFKDGNYNSATAEYTAFINGSDVIFEGRITSNSSLYSHETGSFSVVIPKDFGPFLSYSYIVDWEQYD